MKSNKLSILFLFALISLTNVRCGDPLTEAIVTDSEVVRTAAEVGLSLIKMFVNFSEENNNLKTEVTDLTTKTSQDIADESNIVDIAHNWQTQWSDIKTTYSSLDESLSQIKDTSNLYFQKLWSTNHSISNIQSKQEDSAQNQKLEDK